MDYKKLKTLLWAIVLFLVAGTTLQAQDATVEGTVTNAKTGEPISNVNIVVRGTSLGTSTNAEGHYSLQVPSLQDTLVFSFIGYESEAVPIRGRTEIDVQLQPTTVVAEELVVIGYGAQLESELTGAVEMISPEAFQKQSVTTVAGALQGKMSGVRVTRVSGRPGAGFSIRIRGSNSIKGSNEPLFVVDGLQVNSISHLAPATIASVSVLKGPAATAIYGSRGASGVVVITTKSGTAGQTVIGVDASVGFQTITDRINVLTGVQFANVVNTMREAYGNEIAFTEQEIQEIKDRGGTDWQDIAFVDAAPVQNYKLSVSGGNAEGLRFYISGRYLSQVGTVVKQDYTEYNIRSNFDYKYSDQLNVSLNISAIRSFRKGAVMNVNDAIRMDPTLPPLRNEEGELTLTSRYANIATNPYILVRNKTRRNYNTAVQSLADIQYSFTDNLSLSVTGGVRYTDRHIGQYTTDIINERGIARVVNGRHLFLQNTNQLTYESDFNLNHDLKVDLIFEQLYFRNFGTTTQGANYTTGATGYKNIELGATMTANTRFGAHSLLSFVGRVRYEFQGTYSLTATVRADGSSKFSEGQRWGIFPSGSVSWQIAEEEFMNNVDYINEFTLRLGYGVVGSQSIATYARFQRLRIGGGVNYPISDAGSRVVGVAPSNRLANPNLTWETTKQFNIGLEMAFLNSRLTFTADVYRKETTDLLLDVSLPIYTGLTVVTRNVGSVLNKGLELSVGGAPIRSNNVNLTMNLNVTFNRNKITSLGEGRQKVFPWNPGGPTAGTAPTFLKVGEPLGIFYGVVYKGIYGKNQAQEAARFGKQPGDVWIKNLDKNPDPDEPEVINRDDMTLIGNAQPAFYYGFNSTLNYRNFDLNVVIYGQYGGQIYNISRAQLFGFSGNQLDPVAAAIMDHWTPQNTDTNIPAFNTTGEQYLLSSRWIEDGTYLKIASLSLGYTLPTDIVETLGISSLRVYTVAQNLATFSSYSGFDPQLRSRPGNDAFKGVVYRFPTYPLARTITFGVNIEF